jgi:hypothetical protein
LACNGNKIRNTGRSWNEVKGIAGDRNAWKLFMDALCSTRSKRTNDDDVTNPKYIDQFLRNPHL